MNLKSADVLQPKAMFNNKPIISPDEIRKMLDRMNDKVKQIHKLGQQVLNGSSTSKPTTQPAKETTTQPAKEKTTQSAKETTTQPAKETTTQPAKETTTKLRESSTGSYILNGTITNNATNGIDDQNIDVNTKASNETLTTTLAVSTKTKQTESSKLSPNDTTEPTVTTNTTVTTIIPKGTSFESNTVKTNESLNTDDSDSDTTTPETILSDDEIKKAQNAATKR
ncbi:unnamed protein product [Mytilus edulis]|uniref:Uncharacterized protein n=1 Tax=Mytilus edulis TaxID=6550 RepID=A0A8S3UWK1_MYTED|nr:unnamed protein product [Mytilus edulis]